MTVDFDRLYKINFPTVYRMCLLKFKDPEFALEVTQEAFTRAYIHRHALRDETKFLFWVLRIAKNYGIEQSRLNRLRFNVLPAEISTGQGLFSISRDSRSAVKVDFVRSFMRSLEKPEQQLLLMKYDARMTHEAISRELGVHPSTVKRRISRLKTRITEAYQKEMASER